MSKEKRLKIIGYIIGTIILIVFFVIVIPVIINEAYKVEKGYITFWGANDALSYYGDVLAFAGTVILGAITVKLSINANNINERLISLEEASRTPVLKMTEIKLSDKIESMHIDKKSLYYRLDDQLIQTNADIQNSHLIYNYFIEICLTNISENTICDVSIDKAEILAKNCIPLYLGNQEVKENSANIIAKNNEINIQFKVKEEFFYKFYKDDYRSIKIRIIFSDIFCNKYEEELSFGLSYRYMMDYVESIVPEAFESVYRIRKIL